MQAVGYSQDGRGLADMSRGSERLQNSEFPRCLVSCRWRCVLPVPLALLMLSCLNVQPCAALSLQAIFQRRSSETVAEAPWPRANQIILCEEPCDIDEHCIYFVTGNPRKEMEVNAILAETDIAPFRVSHIDIDLPELQGDAEAICRDKAAAAAARVGGSVIVEDTSLCFSALNGLPGPYIKWFVESLGNEGLYRLLSDYDDKSAYCQCIVGFSTGPGAEPHLFTGRTPGSIVAPTDAGGFGWDAVFVPDGADVTFSRMDMAQKNKISHRAKALSQFIEFCRDNADEIVSAAQSAEAPRDRTQRRRA